MNPHQKSDNGGIEYQKADSDRQLWGARYTRDEVRQWFVDNGYVELDGGKFPKGEREAINNHNRMVRLGKPHPNALRLTL